MLIDKKERGGKNPPAVALGEFLAWFTEVDYSDTCSPSEPGGSGVVTGLASHSITALLITC